jgi:signal transduction histidine kinase
VLFGIGGLLLATIVAVVAISFGVALLIASPANPRMTVAEARDALHGEAGGQELGLRWSLWTTPPLERSNGRSSLAVGALAAALGLPEDRVRVRVRDGGRAGTPQLIAFAPGQQVGNRPLAEPARFRDLLNNPRLRPALLSAGLKMPIAAAAVRQRDGQWLLVEPPSSSSTVWRLRLLIACGLSALLLAPLAWLAARRLTQPIRALADYARGTGIGGHPFDSLDGPREVHEAAAAIADMRLRLQEKSTQQTRMLAAVAHDLRTPLTGLRIRAETAPEGERRRMVADISRMEAMIAQVLTYASEEQADEPPERIDLAALAEQVVDEAREGRRPVTWHPHPPLFIFAAPLSLHRALANLVDNAVRYGDEAEVSVALDEGFAVATVADRGPGLPAELLNRVQEPFFRAETSRSLQTGGVGLGLSIATDVIQRYGGTLILGNRAGGGLIAEVRLPLATL